MFMRKSQSNNTLELYIAVRRTCVKCGRIELHLYDLEASRRDIVNATKDDGWYVGSAGLKCPQCYVKPNYKNKARGDAEDCLKGGCDDE